MYNVGNVHNQIMCACVSAGVFGVVYVCTYAWWCGVSVRVCVCMYVHLCV